MGSTATRKRILSALMGGEPMSCREIMEEAALSRSQVYNGVQRCWRSGLVLRTEEPVREHVRVNHSKLGVTRHLLPYHRYVLRPEERDAATIEGLRYVSFSEDHLDPRGGGRVSKASRILGFLEENQDGAFFSTEVVEALAGHGVRIGDVMPNVRRFEKRGLVYVRGYKSDSRQTPFREGYLLAGIDQGLPREEAIADAVRRTDSALAGRASSSPIMERIHRIRDIVLEHTELRNLVSATYIENKLGCSHGEAEHALKRAMQLYPDIQVMKLFGAWRYFHTDDMGEEDLAAAVEMKRNYIRKTRGRANRIGHNWEAVAEWFIDRFTTGARFWTQDHRKVMDPRRISLHLLRGVGGRRQAAEVDRVWEVNPGVFAPAVTYVLSCRWGLVTKRHVDDFMEVLRWSRDFGADTENGREIKNGVVGVFAGAAFSKRENIQMRDGEVVSLAQYAARRQLQLVTATDFNEKLREALDALWKDPERAGEIMRELRAENEDLYRLEKLLENGGELPAEAVER